MNVVSNEIASEIVSTLTNFYKDPYKGIDLLKKSFKWDKWNLDNSDISRWIAGELLCKLDKMPIDPAAKKLVRFFTSQMGIFDQNDHVWFEKLQKSKTLEVGQIIHRKSGDICYVTDWFEDGFTRFVKLRLIGNQPKKDEWNKETTEGEIFDCWVHEGDDDISVYDRKKLPEWAIPAIEHIKDKRSKMEKNEKHETRIKIRKKYNRLEIEEIVMEYLGDGHTNDTMNIYLV